jgi:outer membrane lipoprotein-sorting protein
MKINNLNLILFLLPIIVAGQVPEAETILNSIDKNLSSDSRIVTSKMIINSARGSRTVEAKTWAKGDFDAFTEYLSPPRESGTKMLKTKDQLWIYSPSTDRTIQISGHMLRQSVMGSDLSYEDMMNNEILTANYNSKVTGSEIYQGTDCYILELKAIKDDLAYLKRVMWVHKKYYVPLKEELYAKSGKLLKRLELSDLKQIDGRWYPMKMTFKDMLKSGKGTEFIISDIQFNKEIPKYLLTKAALKK